MVLSENQINELISGYEKDDRINRFKTANINQSNLKTLIIKQRKGFDNADITEEEMNEMLVNALNAIDKQHKKFSILLDKCSKIDKAFNGAFFKKTTFQYLPPLKVYLMNLVTILLNEKKSVEQALSAYKNWDIGEYRAFYRHYYEFIRQEKETYKKIETCFYNLLNEVRVKAAGMNSKKGKQTVMEFGVFLILATLSLWAISFEEVQGILKLLFSISTLYIGFDITKGIGDYLGREDPTFKTLETLN